VGKLALVGRRFRLTHPEATVIFTIDRIKGDWIFFHAPWEQAAQRRQPIAWFASKVRAGQVTGVYPDARPFSKQMNWHFRRAIEQVGKR
jgi:hypothetical protein